MALRLAAEDVPAQPRGDGKGVIGMVGVLDEGCIVRACFRDEQVLCKIGRVVSFRARLLSHAHEEGSEVAAAAAV